MPPSGRNPRTGESRRRSLSRWARRLRSALGHRIPLPPDDIDLALTQGGLQSVESAECCTAPRTPIHCRNPNRAPQHFGFRHVPALRQRLQCAHGFDIQRIRRFDRCYGHTDNVWPYSSDVNLLRLGRTVRQATVHALRRASMRLSCQHRARHNEFGISLFRWSPFRVPVKNRKVVFGPDVSSMFLVSGSAAAAEDWWEIRADAGELHA